MFLILSSDISQAEMSVNDGFLKCLDSIFMSALLRKDTLGKLHAGHQGIIKSIELAA